MGNYLGCHHKLWIKVFWTKLEGTSSCMMHYLPPLALALNYKQNLIKDQWLFMWLAPYCVVFKVRNLLCPHHNENNDCFKPTS